MAAPCRFAVPDTSVLAKYRGKIVKLKEVLDIANLEYADVKRLRSRIRQRQNYLRRREEARAARQAAL